MKLDSGCCPVMRRKRIERGTLDVNTGEVEVSSIEWRDEPCNTPLFGRTVCRSCETGWGTAHNHIIDSGY